MDLARADKTLLILRNAPTPLLQALREIVLVIERLRNNMLMLSCREKSDRAASAQ